MPMTPSQQRQMDRMRTRKGKDRKLLSTLAIAALNASQRRRMGQPDASILDQLERDIESANREHGR